MPPRSAFVLHGYAEHPWPQADMDGEVAPRPTRVAVQDRVAREFGQARQRVIAARPVTEQPPQELAGFSYLIGGGEKALGPGTSDGGPDRADRSSWASHCRTVGPRGRRGVGARRRLAHLIP